jgi:hypothetical protein
MTKTLDLQFVSLSHSVIRSSNLFRNSYLDIRVLPEYNFSFRHYLRAGSFFFYCAVLHPENPIDIPAGKGAMGGHDQGCVLFTTAAR